MPPGHEEAGRAVAPPPEVVEVWVVEPPPPPPPPQPAATSARAPTTPRKAAIVIRFLKFSPPPLRSWDRPASRGVHAAEGKYQGSGVRVASRSVRSWPLSGCPY